MKIIGVMSGTSLDGIDFCYVDLNKALNDYKYQIICAKTYEYDNDLKKQLQSAFQWSSDEVSLLNHQYTSYVNGMIHTFIKDFNIQDVDLICSHGHTIWHKPNEGFTLQIGNLPHLKEGFDIPIICDFRVQDVALGGQGAPLVPFGDELLFGSYDYCLNLGGFSNISFKNFDRRVAYDVCPVNTLLNYYTLKFFGFHYDKDGHLAKQGVVFEPLVEMLNTIEYYNKSYPKSLGVEDVQLNFIPIIDAFDIKGEDVLASIVEHIAIQIGKALEHSLKGKILITGGGAYNKWLIERISDRCYPHQVIVPDAYTVEFKEALIFAFLGYLRIHNQINCLASVTGAKEDHSSGIVYK